MAGDEYLCDGSDDGADRFDGNSDDIKKGSMILIHRMSSIAILSIVIMLVFRLEWTSQSQVTNSDVVDP